jgi:hypothetical protein
MEFHYKARPQIRDRLHFKKGLNILSFQMVSTIKIFSIENTLAYLTAGAVTKKKNVL